MTRQMCLFRPTTLVVVGIHDEVMLRVFHDARWPMLHVDTTIEATQLIADMREDDPYLPLILLLAPTDAAGVPTWLFAATLTQTIPTMRQDGMALVVLANELDDVDQRRFQLAGCTILPAPTRIGDLECWHACIDTDATTTAYAGEAEGFRDSAAAAYQFMVKANRVWRLPEVKILLAGFRARHHRRALDMLLLERLGGYQAARNTLQRCSTEICAIEGAILRGILQGHCQKRIALNNDYTREWICRRMPTVYAHTLLWLNHGVKSSVSHRNPEPVYALMH